MLAAWDLNTVILSLSASCSLCTSMTPLPSSGLLVPFKERRYTHLFSVKDVKVFLQTDFPQVSSRGYGKKETKIINFKSQCAKGF